VRTAPESGARPQAQRHDSPITAPHRPPPFPARQATNKPSRLANSRILSSPLIIVFRPPLPIACIYSRSSSEPALLPHHPVSPAAASPPAVSVTPGPASPDFSGKSRKGCPARQRGTPLPRSPGVERNLKSEARRRPGDLLRPSARDHHLETTILRRGCTRLSPECALLLFAMQQSRPGRRPLQLTALPLRLDAGRRGSSGTRPVSVEA
jgi:hypothetical protein